MKSIINSTSFFRETIRNHKWMMLVIGILTFLQYPVQLALSITSWYDAYDLTFQAEKVSRYIAQEVSFSTTGMVMICTGLMIGVFTGVWSYAYLHNKRQVALYHSIPISRRNLMITKFVACTITYAIPLAFANVLFVGILVVYGFCTWVMIGQLFSMFCYTMFMFGIGYLLAAIAMLLTGKIFIGVFGSFVFLLYFPALKLGIYMLASLSFYCSIDNTWKWLEWIGRISPITYMQVVEWNQPIYLIILFGVIIVLWEFHRLLLRVRPSEAAGKAMAYEKIGTGIQACLIFIATIGMALFGYTSSYEKDVWLVLGGLMGLTVSYILIQFLYGVEFKQLHNKLRMLVIVGVLSFLVIFSIDQDWFGYNTYIPDYDEIVDINIEFTEGNQYSTSFLEEGIYDAHMGVDADTYALMEVVVESSLQAYTEDSYNMYGEKERVSIYVEYHLNNGQVLKRRYTPYVEDVVAGLKGLWDNEEFLNVMYPIRVQDASLVTQIYLSTDAYYTYYQSESLFWDNIALQIAFMEAYQKDAQDVSVATLEETPIGVILYNLQGEYYSDFYHVYVYPSYSNTLSFLDEYGVTLPYAVEAEDVAEIIIANVTYTDKTSLGVLLDELIYYDLDTLFVEVNKEKSATVVLSDESSWLCYFIE